MKLFFIFIFVLFSVLSFGQIAIDQQVSINVDNKPLVNILYQIKTENDIQFYFDPNDLPIYLLNGDYKNIQLFKILKDFLNGSSIIILPHGDRGVVLVQKDKVSKDYIFNLKELWDSGEFKYPIVDEVKQMNFTFGSSSKLKTKSTLNLVIFDENTDEAIVGAVLKNEDYSIAETSDVNGKISINSNTRRLILELSYIGYQSVQLNIDLFDDGLIEIPMQTQNVLLNEIEIIGNSNRSKLDNTKVGSEMVDLEKIKDIPQVLGEVDILKSLEILPGVTSVGDISTGFNVRGGNVDESLVLFNDGMIFNPTHIVGFISAFNAESINSTTLYKGYVDGEFGNRSSAILDIKADAENVNEFRATGGISTSLFKLYVQDKVNDKIKYKVSGRASYNDYLLNLVTNVKIKNSSANFFDFNASFNYKINKNHVLLVNSYNSDDFFEFNDEFGFEWKNGHLGLMLKSKWSDSIFSKVSVNRGFYNSKQFVLNSPSASDFSSGINYLKLIWFSSLKLSNKGYFKVGVESINYNSDEDILAAGEGSVVVDAKVQRLSSNVIAPFFTFNYDVLNNLTIETSLRYSNYFSKGPGKIFNYENDIIEFQNLDGFENIEGKDPEGKYSVVEPRFSLNYKYNENVSLRAGINRMSQNLIQVSNGSSALPSDFWIFANRYIPPQIVNQVSLGLFKTNDLGSYNLSIEGFLKDYDDLRSLKQFPDVILNEHLETELLITRGSSYGMEIFLEKNKGKWVGSLAYTYSRSFRRTNDIRGELNSGDEFPADFDIPHQLNIVASYKWLPTVSLQFAYVYKSGRPTTLPTETILQDGFLVPIYSGRNQARIPYYSRLDFSINLDMRKAKQNGFRSSFNLGFFNVLKRKNAYNVFFRRSEGGNIQPFQFSIIGTIVPNFTWNFTF